MRTKDTKGEFYNSIAGEFDSIMNMYDTNRRVEVIFDDFLVKENLKGKTLLDGGCGTGWFTKKAIERGAIVTSIDIAEKLVEITKNKNPQTTALKATLLELPFADNTFDYVISSDVIEHTPDPYKATAELIRVLKPNGKICITVPNKTFWYFSLVIANFIGLRKYNGFENWVHYSAYKKFLQNNSLIINEYKGIHMFPFVLKPLNKLLYRIDKIFENRCGAMMVNIAAYAQKHDS